MQRSILLLGAFGMLSLFCLVAGCVKQSPNGEAAPGKPAAKGDTNWDVWLQDRPMNTAMRRMWVDCGNIVESTNTQDRLALANASSDLARRAEQFASHFRTLQDANQRTNGAAAEGDWASAGKHLAAAQQGCDNCHFEFWPLAAHGIDSEVLEAWQKTRDAKRAEQVFEAPAKVRLSMGAMRDTMTTAGRAVEERDMERLRDASDRIGKFSGKNLKYWESIAREASAIAAIARTGQLLGVGSRYTTIRSVCTECHETTTEGRGLNPLPWTQD
ncbi:MAG: hypothetical protein K8I27_02530 [Planctomycetes bacterium]|nr:hypothetical protein [Planctomycetota bacterium]